MCSFVIIHLPGAVQRWVLSQPYKAKISEECREMAGIDDTFRVHKENDPTR